MEIEFTTLIKLSRFCKILDETCSRARKASTTIYPASLKKQLVAEFIQSLQQESIDIEKKELLLIDKEVQAIILSNYKNITKRSNPN